MTTPADIQRWGSLLPPSKQGAVKVKTVADIGQPLLYHISTDQGLRSMIPSVTRRTLTTEDRAIPRISVAPTLAGCILAYQACWHDFASGEYSGWYVYGLPYQHAVRPSKELLPDVEITDEHWLVTFDPETVVYTPIPVAKFFVTSVETVRRLRLTIDEYRGYIEVISPDGLSVAKGKTLPKGRHNFVWNSRDLKDYTCADGFHFEKVSAGEYITKKNETVEMLSFGGNMRPGSAYW